MTLCFILSIRFLKYPLQGPYSSYQNCIEFLVYLCICLCWRKKCLFLVIGRWSGDDTSPRTSSPRPRWGSTYMMGAGAVCFIFPPWKKRICLCLKIQTYISYLFIFRRHCPDVLAQTGASGNNLSKCRIQMTATLADTSANTIETWDRSLWKVRSIKSI